jgi:hypothetical protein
MKPCVLVCLRRMRSGASWWRGIELQDLRPKATSNTATAMKKQMIAERARRSEFIIAEGNKAAMRLKSEGIKIVKANMVCRSYVLRQCLLCVL